jgi:predicted nucleic acid-binding protein
VIVFLDTTALAAIFLDGETGRGIRELVVQEGDGVAIATVSTVEFVAFLRDLSEEASSPAAVQKVAAAFMGAIKDLVQVQPDLEEAGLLVVKFRLEPGQAQVLSAALKLRDQIRRNTAMVPQPVILATLDEEMRAAAVLEGLPVHP